MDEDEKRAGSASVCKQVSWSDITDTMARESIEPENVEENQPNSNNTITKREL